MDQAKTLLPTALTALREEEARKTTLSEEEARATALRDEETRTMASAAVPATL